MKTPECCAFQQQFFMALLHFHCYSAAKILRAIICQFGITFIIDSGIREIFAYVIRNPGLWDPKKRSRNLESHQRLESRI